MSSDAASAVRMGPLPRSAGRAILWGGLISGTLDITAAFVTAGARDIGPVRVLQGIAEALLGPSSYSGGPATAALGLLMHFGVALSATAVFFLLSRLFPVLVDRAVPSGLVYGAVVFIVMYRVVIPLTVALNSLYLADFDRRIPPLRLRQLLIHVFCVGLPIALAVRRFGPLPRDADA